ncbi:MAG TPA: AGE family epimerase/isomerase [Steroidobacteraceae bacterium]|jgi:mannose/cellobiose epimerase-like protein (N-acyl-D-glucosamine 2-epimerase family)|nr:AGE family epimerase/isomerase [Steroidobacteraceae bacterium]
MTLRSAQARVADSYRQLLRWLLEDACPLWSTCGVDSIRGGFEEMLEGSRVVAAPRRVRVQPRQIAAFSQASRLGWRGDVEAMVRLGLDALRMRYRRDDGLYRGLVAPDGAVLDDRALLYDQAFVLLGFAESQKVFGAAARAEVADAARALRALLRCYFKREGPGFESAAQPPLPPLSSNAHMHLLEASLASYEADGDPEWLALADEIGELALTRFIDSTTGAVREHFTPTWDPLPGIPGRVLEPGHHFEWAWLLLRWAGAHRADARDAAFRLIDLGERHGVHAGVAINALLDDFSVHDASARLWPQTERIKAAALAARATGEAQYWISAADAAASLWRYLQTPTRGSWHDRLMPDGQFIEEPAPASSFYHIVGAIAELGALLNEGHGGK